MLKGIIPSEGVKGEEKEDPSMHECVEGFFEGVRNERAYSRVFIIREDGFLIRIIGESEAKGCKFL